MKRTDSFVGLLFSALVVSCADEGAGVEVGYKGSAQRMEVTIGTTACEQTESLQHFRCGVVAGNHRVSLRCLDTDLPPAYLEGFFAPGSGSNYVLFKRVCDITANEIMNENMRAKGALMVWGE